VRDSAEEGGKKIIRLDIHGQPVEGFREFRINQSSYHLKIDRQGRILLALSGYLDGITPHVSLMRYLIDGREDPTFHRLHASQITEILLQRDDKILLAGFGGVKYRTGGLFRLNPDGSPDKKFNDALGVGIQGNVNQVTLDSDGKIEVKGELKTFGG